MRAAWRRSCVWAADSWAEFRGCQGFGSGPWRVRSPPSRATPGAASAAQGPARRAGTMPHSLLTHPAASRCSLSRTLLEGHGRRLRAWWSLATTRRRGAAGAQSSGTRGRPCPPGAQAADLCGGAVSPAQAPPSRMLMLGIETSCDDTAAAVVAGDGRVLGEAIAHQHEVHRPWGGVVPSLAREAHLAAIDAVVDRALAQAGVGPQELSAVAVTVGPGLSLCLSVGLRKARQLSAAHRLPLVPLHHMEAHALVARMPGIAEGPPVSFPFVCLLVSGGHNLLLLVRGVGRYTVLGSTMDDALGEAYDKVARMLGLELEPSGGAALERVARGGDAAQFAFTEPLRGKPGADFSFSGLKTAVRLAIEDCMPGGAEGAAVELTPAQEQARADIAAGFQAVAVRHLCARVSRGAAWAMEEEPGVRDLVVAGGVAANAEVRSSLGQVASQLGLRMVCPPPKWCTDNGVMAAWAGVERACAGFVEPPLPPGLLQGDEEWLDLKARWPLGERRAGLPPPGRGAKRRQVHPDLTRDTAEAEAAMEEWVRGSGVCGLLGVASDAGLHDIALAVARADEAMWAGVELALAGADDGACDMRDRILAMRHVLAGSGQTR